MHSVTYDTYADKCVSARICRSVTVQYQYQKKIEKKKHQLSPLRALCGSIREASATQRNATYKPVLGRTQQPKASRRACDLRLRAAALSNRTRTITCFRNIGIKSRIGKERQLGPLDSSPKDIRSPSYTKLASAGQREWWSS